MKIASEYFKKENEFKNLDDILSDTLCEELNKEFYISYTKLVSCDDNSGLSENKHCDDQVIEELFKKIQ